MPLLTLSALLRPAANGTRRVLFARSADAANFNAQAKNAQNILRHWRSSTVRPAIFSFYAPDPAVAANPNVDIIKVPPDRLWRAKVFAAYLGAFDAVFCPGLHHYADWAALKLRALSGRPLRIVSTMEGLLGAERDELIEAEYANVAGHDAPCQKVPASHWRRNDEIYSMADRIIAISPFLAKQAEARYGSKAMVVPLGVDLTLFHRSSWPLGVRPRVICAASVGPRKRPRLFLHLAKLFPEADFIWFGEGELRAQLIAEASTDRIQNVSFPGGCAPEVLAVKLRQSQIMLLPSHAEGVPKITQEAAASGLAQIVFGHYEAPTVIDGTNGFVVWDDATMEDRLRMLLKDPILVKTMGQAGRRMAEPWRWELIAPLWQRAIISAVPAAR